LATKTISDEDYAKIAPQTQVRANGTNLSLKTNVRKHARSNMIGRDAIRPLEGSREV